MMQSNTKIEAELSLMETSTPSCSCLTHDIRGIVPIYCTDGSLGSKPTDAKERLLMGFKRDLGQVCYVLIRGTLRCITDVYSL